MYNLALIFFLLCLVLLVSILFVIVCQSTLLTLFFKGATKIKVSLLLLLYVHVRMGMDHNPSLVLDVNILLDLALVIH